MSAAIKILTENEFKGIENISLEIKIATFADKPNRVRLFSRLSDTQHDYIKKNMENIQLWMLVKSRYSSGSLPNRVSTKTKWRHPNNVPVGLGSVSILPDITTENISTSKLFPPTVYNYGGDNKTGGLANRPLVGFGIGNGYYKTDLEGPLLSTPVDISHSLTGGFMPTEFSLNSSNLVTLLDGTKALQIDIYLRNFTDNLAYETFRNSFKECRMVGNPLDRLRFRVDSSGFKKEDARKQRQFFKFCLTELRGDKKVDSKVTNQTLTAQLATLVRYKAEYGMYTDFLNPRAIGFSVWS